MSQKHVFPSIWLKLVSVYFTIHAASWNRNKSRRFFWLHRETQTGKPSSSKLIHINFPMWVQTWKYVLLVLSCYILRLTRWTHSGLHTFISCLYPRRDTTVLTSRSGSVLGCWTTSMFLFSQYVPCWTLVWTLKCTLTQKARGAKILLENHLNHL